MRLVVDTNVLFSFFWKESITKNLIMKLDLYSPEFALEEINKHKTIILQKTKLSSKEFDLLRKELAMAVHFVPLEEYSIAIAQAARASPDGNDADFFALAMHLHMPLWSNDKKLKEQNILTVVSTTDLLNNPEFGDTIYPIE
jgi:predicted nucleic acid-binding protein